MRRLEILLGPLIDAIERRLQILQRISDAEAQVAFAEFPERCAGKRRDSSLFEKSIGKWLRLPSGLSDVRKNVERAVGHAAGKTFDLVQSSDEDIAAPPELGAHVIHRTLIAAQRLDPPPSA